jgi:hypothetical protein
MAIEVRICDIFNVKMAAKLTNIMRFNASFGIIEILPIFLTLVYRRMCCTLLVTHVVYIENITIFFVS